MRLQRASVVQDTDSQSMRSDSGGMELIKPTMKSLFAQLGEPNDDAAIARFIERNSTLAGHIPLHEAAFWTASQATFLRDCILQDATWAPVVDQLNAELHKTVR